MLSQEDIIKLSEVLATKKDIKEIKTDIDGLREQIQALVTSVDKLVKEMIAVNQEKTMEKLQKERYERWFRLIADKLGIKLEY
jgi:archaellum component FlaC